MSRSTEVMIEDTKLVNMTVLREFIVELQVQQESTFKDEIAVVNATLEKLGQDNVKLRNLLKNIQQHLKSLLADLTELRQLPKDVSDLTSLLKKYASTTDENFAILVKDISEISDYITFE